MITLSSRQLADKYPAVRFVGDMRIAMKGVDIGKACTIYEGSRIEPEVTIGNNCYIHSGARLEEGCVIGRGCSIGVGAFMYENSSLADRVAVPAGARIPQERKNVTRCIVIGGIGQTGNITGVACDDGLIICIGCLGDYMGVTVQGAIDAIDKKYHCSHEYFTAIQLIEKWYSNGIKRKKGEQQC